MTSFRSKNDLTGTRFNSGGSMLCVTALASGVKDTFSASGLPCRLPCLAK